MVLEFLLEGLFRQIRQIQSISLHLLSFKCLQLPISSKATYSGVTFSASLQIKI